jgi:signal transduction histidine kinase
MTEPVWAASGSRSAADSHYRAVPEVTFAAARIANAAHSPQHAGMRALLSHLLRPLNLALLLTWLAVGLSLQDAKPQSLALCWGLMVAFLVASLVCDLPQLRPRHVNALLMFIAACALTLVWLAPRTGTTPVLLVVLAAQLSLVWSLRATLLAMGVVDVLFYLLMVLIYAGFQAFALLVGHYATNAERTRDRLALVNADLLATRALLADSARDAERLRMARELHDVAGHKLTAIHLNLRALASDPAFSQRQEVRLAQDLSSELLTDIRNVVQALRDSRGLDLETALRALAAPLPKLRMDLRMDGNVQVTDPALAETLLRLVQESLTNAARHAGANRVSVEISRTDAEVMLLIEDDGTVKGPLREGNGMTGMRERVEASRGDLRISTAPHGGLRIEARLPA